MNMNQYLSETYYLDYSHPAIQGMVEEFKELTIKEQIKGLFKKTRDQWRYNPYLVYTHPRGYKASFIVGKEEGHCIDKSILFISGLRALGIPARLRLAKVVNHIAVDRLIEKMGSNYIAPHGITELFVNNQWVKASNAFNQSLCDRFKVDALEFDGSDDAIFQPFNREQQQFMEYVEDYGHFEDVPMDFILETFKTSYPELYAKGEGKDRIEI
jgi:transglutaminase-like putative cysteine protease